ncbi:MAG: hypothetical protein V4501_03075 [Pseudomonadota bacterium]
MSKPKKKEPFKLSVKENNELAAFLNGEDNENTDLFGNVLPVTAKLRVSLVLTNHLSMKQINKIIKFRSEEGKRLYGNAYKKNRNALVTPIQRELDLLELLNMLSEKELKGSENTTQDEDYDTMIDSFYVTRDNVITEMRVLVYKMLQNPSQTISKDINLLFDVANNLSKFMDEPKNTSLMQKLVLSSNLVYKKMGPVWHGIKVALAATIGVICIVTGILGLVPSFGASVGLIAIGASLCAAAGLSEFKWFKPKLTAAKNITKDVQELLDQAKKIFSYKQYEPREAIREHKQSPSQSLSLVRGRVG